MDPVQLSIVLTVANATAERDHTGKTQSEVIQMIGTGSTANLSIRLSDRALFGKIHPKQQFVAEISSLSPIEPVAENTDGKKDH